MPLLEMGVDLLTTSLLHIYYLTEFVRSTSNRMDVGKVSQNFWDAGSPPTGDGDVADP